MYLAKVSLLYKYTSSTTTIKTESSYIVAENANRFTKAVNTMSHVYFNRS